MNKLTFIVPRANDHGNSLPLSVFGQLQDYIIKHGLGFTCHIGTGHWVGDMGKPADELGTVFHVAGDFDQLVSLLIGLRAIIGNAPFSQQALYFEFNGIPSIVPLCEGAIVKYTTGVPA